MTQKKIRWNGYVMDVSRKDGKTGIVFMRGDGSVAGQYEFNGWSDFNTCYFVNAVLMSMVGDDVNQFVRFKNLTGLAAEWPDPALVLEETVSALLSPRTTFGTGSQRAKITKVLQLLHHDDAMALCKFAFNEKRIMEHSAQAVDAGELDKQFSPDAIDIMLSLCEFAGHVEHYVVRKLRHDDSYEYNMNNYDKLDEWSSDLDLLDLYCGNNMGDIREIHCVGGKYAVVERQTPGGILYSSTDRDTAHIGCMTFEECLLRQMFPINFNSVMVLYNNDNGQT